MPPSAGKKKRKSTPLIPPAFIAEIRGHIFRLAARQLDYLEHRLDPLAALDNPSGHALLRETADLVGLWRCCERSGCWRAQRCRREHGRCLARFAPLIPPPLAAHAIATLRARHCPAAPRDGKR